MSLYSSLISDVPFLYYYFSKACFKYIKYKYWYGKKVGVEAYIIVTWVAFHTDVCRRNNNVKVLDGAFNTGFFLQMRFFGFGAKGPLEKLCKCCFFSIWTIWMERNRKVFKNRVLRVDVVWEGVNFLAKLWARPIVCFWISR